MGLQNKVPCVKEEKSGGVLGGEGEIGDDGSGVARKRQTEFGYFACKEGSKAVGERDIWSRGR